MSDVLDPYRLAQMTPWSADAWTSALNAARSADIPEPILVDCVSRGAWPGLVKALPSLVQVGRRLCESVTALTDATQSARLTPPPSEPTDVRERALWMRQHRNTGPDHTPTWRT